MTKTNKRHAKINRAALMQGIAAMEAMKPKEKDELTQKEAIEIAAAVVQDLLGKGYSLAEVIEMMKDSFGLTLNAATVRSYLRQVKAANDAAAEQKPLARRGRKAKSVRAAEDNGKTDVVSIADCKVDDEDTGAVEESDVQENVHGQDEARQNNATDMEVDDQIDAVLDESEYDIYPVDELLAQFPADADLDMEGRG